MNTALDAARLAWSEGEWDVALGHYERAIPLAVASGGVEHLAEIFRRIADVHRERGDLELAREAYGVSREIAERNDLPALACSALMGEAAIEYHRGCLRDAESIYLQAREVAERIDDGRLAAMIHQNLGTMASVRGEAEAALASYRVALVYYARQNDRSAMAGALTNLGMVHVDLQEFPRAEDCFSEAYSIASRLEDTALLGHVEINRVELYIRRGDFAAARDSCDRAFEIFGRLGAETGIGEVYKFYGVLYRESDRNVLADRHLGSAVEIARRCQDRLLEAECLDEWALVHLAEDRSREALQCLNEAHRLFADLSARRELLDLDRRLDGLESTYLKVVRAWGESIESKDRYTAGHCERVANYACLLAESVGITGRDLTWLRMGGYLHDVGKIAVPPEVLNKPGKLTDEEFRLIQSHAAEGDAIVAELNFPWDIRPAVRWHHERWDGSGYPDGLSGEAIPLTARILCVADVYDALTSTRSYRPALSREEALDVMRRDVGRFFDPELFPLFESLITQRCPKRDHRFPEFAGVLAVA